MMTSYQDDIPLSSLLPQEVFDQVRLAIDEAAMCWDPPPDGVYDTLSATKIAFDLCAFLVDFYRGHSLGVSRDVEF